MQIYSSRNAWPLPVGASPSASGRPASPAVDGFLSAVFDTTACLSKTRSQTSGVSVAHPLVPPAMAEPSRDPTSSAGSPLSVSSTESRSSACGEEDEYMETTVLGLPSLRYMQIIFSEGLEISQPALDPELSFDIHHRITVRNRKTRVHRRVYFGGSVNCSYESRGPPCTGWVEGMVPVFSRSAWRCVWHLIQNDLIHGWGLDMKLGYCAQGDRIKNVGVIDTEFIIHHGIPSLGGVRAEKAVAQKSLDSRTRIRRQSTAELEKFKERWNRAAEEDRDWTDPFED